MGSKPTLQQKRILRKSDRMLGDEWADWTEESVEPNQENTNASRSLYLGFLAIVVALLLISAYILNYLIEPRLAQFHPQAPNIVTVLRTIFSAVTIVWYLLIVLAIFTKRNFGFLFIGRKFFLLTLTPIILRLGHRLGVSRDRLSASFIKVSNSLVRAAGRHKITARPLVLLPRCLQKDLRSRIISLAKNLGCDVHVVAGGEAARKAISQKHPTAVVGVACERDLLSGICDTSLFVPVLGIANKRPEGPCKNTVVDLEKVEDAIRFFFGS